MWIVALALRRPYTFVVMALVLLLLTPLVVLRMPVDVLPDINIPVISVVWNYAGMAPDEMADRIVANSERGLTITVNDIEHIESQSLNGIGVIKIFFQPTGEYPDRIGTDHGDVANHPARLAARNDSASDRYLFRFLNSDCPAWFKQQDAARATTFRSR